MSLIIQYPSAQAPKQEIDGDMLQLNSDALTVSDSTASVSPEFLTAFQGGFTEAIVN
jgi:hypothetical protein